MICHILTMGIPEPLQRILENAAREEKLLLFSLPDMETAERLLVHGKPGVVIVDLELFTQSAPDFLGKIRRQSPCIIVLGHCGNKLQPAGGRRDRPVPILPDAASHTLGDHGSGVVIGPGHREVSSKVQKEVQHSHNLQGIVQIL